MREWKEGEKEKEKRTGGYIIELVVTVGDWRSTLLEPSKESAECSLAFSLRRTFICPLAPSMDEIALRY